MATIDASYVRTRLTYDPSSGKLTWLPKTVRAGAFRRHDLAWNTNYADQETGSVGAYGYLLVNIGGRPHAAHRLAWLIVHGEWPKLIDHANGIRTDNRLANLREATPTQNCMNAAMRKDNLSGAKGVSWHPQSGKWRASIKVDGRRKSLGLHGDIASAAEAYTVAAKANFGEFAYARRT
jgi:hypothetical protein